MSHKFLLLENIGEKFSKAMSHELVFGDELERHLQSERMAQGKAGGERLSRRPK